MKRIIITSLVATLFAANTNAQTDTLVVRQPEEVRVITTADTLNISIEGSKENPLYYYNKTIIVDSEKEEVTTTSQNVGSGLGWDFSLLEGRNSTPEIELSLRAQMYVGWNFISDTSPTWSPTFMSVGEAKMMVWNWVGVDLNIGFNSSVYPSRALVSLQIRVRPLPR